MKRRVLKIVLLVLLLVNYVLLSLRWVWWMLDDKYGMGERLRSIHSLTDSSGVNDELSHLYSELHFDLLYFAVFTLVIYLVFALILNTYTSKEN